MNNEYIGVIDSGVGGLSVLKELVLSMPNENYVYYGDNQNAPYGEKSDRRLLELLFNDISMFNGFKLKALIVGCNTLSVCVLKYLRKSFNFEIFGVYPPTLTPLIKGYKTLLLSTPKTAQNTSALRGLTVKPLSNLAIDIERNLYDLGEINIYDHLGNIKGDFDAVILGCTHYDLIKNQIFDHFQPRYMYSGIDFTVKRVKEFCKNRKSLVNHSRNKIIFIGKTAKINEKFWFSVVENGFTN